MKNERAKTNNLSTCQLKTCQLKNMKLLKNILALSQSELKNLTVTHGGTIKVEVADQTRLPHCIIDKALVEMGHHEIIVSRPFRRRPYTGARSACLHKGDGSFGKYYVSTDKEGPTVFCLRATLKNRTELMRALEEAITTIAADSTMDERSFDEVAHSLRKEWRTGKAAHDRLEDKREKEFFKQEENDEKGIMSIIND